LADHVQVEKAQKVICEVAEGDEKIPYKLVGNTIYHFKGGKWSPKQKATSAKNAKSALALLRGVEHGWHPTGKKRRRKK
jgi:hypothetical protein